MLNSKLEESEENLDELPPTRKIYIRDISEVFLEVAPSTSFRVYLSAETSNIPDYPQNSALIPHSASEEEALEAGVVHEEGSDITTPSTNTQTTRYGNVVSYVFICMQVMVVIRAFELISFYFLLSVGFALTH